MAIRATINPTPHSNNLVANSFAQLDFTTVSKEFEKGKQANEAQNYDCAIEAYTRALDHLQADVESVILLQRANVYARQQQFDLALADYSNTYLKNSHNKSTNDTVDGSGTCYHDTANQEQLKQKALMYFCGANDDSLEKSMREALKQKYTDIMDKLYFHNQWPFHHLSYDVMIRILSYLPYWKDRGQLSLTCRFWNKFILKDWGKMWETIDYNTPTTHSSIDDYYSWDPRIKTPMPLDKNKTRSFMDCVVPDQVRNIILDLKNNYGDRFNLLNSKVFDLNLNNVESLDVILADNLLLPRMLQMGTNTMKSVTLRYELSQWEEFGYYTDAISTSAHTCPNISDITIHVTGYRFEDQQASNQPIQPTIPSSNLFLSTLKLYCYPTSMRDTVRWLSQLLDKATLLVLLELKIAAFPVQILETVFDHSPPLLQHLICTDHPVYIGFVSQHTTKNNSNKYSVKKLTPGLKSLHLELLMHYRGRDGDGTDINMKTDQTVGNMLRAHHNTLQELDIVWDPIFLKDHTSFITLANYGGPQLRVLKLYIDATVNPNEFTHANAIANIVDGCPLLEIAQLSNLCFLDKQVYCSLGRLGRLQSLGIDIQKLNYDDSSVVPVLQTDGMKMLFQKSHSLQKFFIIQHDGGAFQKQSILLDQAVDTLSKCIATSSTLKKLDFSKCTLSNNQLMILLDQIKKDHPPNVTRLIINIPENGIYGKDLLKAFALIGGSGALQSLIIHDNQGFFKKLYNLVLVFEEYQGLKPFLIQIKFMHGGHVSGFCKERSSLADFQDVNCRYKRYNVSSSNHFLNTIPDLYCNDCMYRHVV